jgi:hypothetical protein
LIHISDKADKELKSTCSMHATTLQEFNGLNIKFQKYARVETGNNYQGPVYQTYPLFCTTNANNKEYVNANSSADSAYPQIIADRSSSLERQNNNNYNSPNVSNDSALCNSDQIRRKLKLITQDASKIQVTIQTATPNAEENKENYNQHSQNSRSNSRRNSRSDREDKTHQDSPKHTKLIQSKKRSNSKTIEEHRDRYEREHARFNEDENMQANPPPMIIPTFNIQPNTPSKDERDFRGLDGTENETDPDNSNTTPNQKSQKNKDHVTVSFMNDNNGKNDVNKDYLPEKEPSKSFQIFNDSSSELQE